MFMVVSSLNPAAAAKSLQLCPTLCDPIDGSPPGSPTSKRKGVKWACMQKGERITETKTWRSVVLSGKGLTQKGEILGETNKQTKNLS